jgi:hypothetical protein
MTLPNTSNFSEKPPGFGKYEGQSADFPNISSDPYFYGGLW